MSYAESRRRSSANGWLILLCAILGLMLAKDYWLEKQATHQERPVAPRADLAMNEQATIARFEEASPSVVYITSVRLERTRSFFGGLNIHKIPSGTGTGFIWNDQGHVVTNFHVIQGASEAQVTLSDQTVWDAKVVGAEPDKDIAVLKIDAPKSSLRPLQLGLSSDLRVGQSVLAIGNPFGLDQTLTTGVISGLGREIESVTQRPIQDVIQTDAAINPGNSGGPLLDSSGRLIGVNTAIYSPSGSSAGIGFAVPVDAVNRIVPQIIKYGRAIKPVLGIQLLSDAMARQQRINGIIIRDVAPGSGAADAGLEGLWADRRGNTMIGDVITGIEGQDVSDQNSLYRVLDRFKVGDEVTLTVVRPGSKPRDKQVILSPSSR
ncbi:MAG: trypsin-like serine protease [Verrucomicrobiaceae bacterium]|nr:trypsin-like serine protease [Verrucomicrobiaceae bacterium]